MKAKYERTSYTLSLLFKYYYPKGNFMLYSTNKKIGFNYINNSSIIYITKYIAI